MAGYARHRLERPSAVARYFASNTTRAMFAAVVAVVAVILMAFTTAGPAVTPPQPQTAAQRALPAAVATWMERAATAGLTTATATVQADSAAAPGKSKKAAPASCNDEE